MLQDTSPERSREYLEHLRRLTPAEKCRIINSLSAGVRRMAEIGILERFPGIGPEELRVRLAVRMYGRAMAGRVFKEIPEDAA